MVAFPAFHDNGSGSGQRHRGVSKQLLSLPGRPAVVLVAGGTPCIGSRVCKLDNIFPIIRTSPSSLAGKQLIQRLVTSKLVAYVQRSITNVFNNNDWRAWRSQSVVSSNSA
jgi:hypothetical protein